MIGLAAQGQIELIERPLKVTGAQQLVSRPSPIILDTLAAAYAATGQFEQALTAVDDALKLSEKSGMVEMADAIRKHRQWYRQGKPYWEGE